MVLICQSEKFCSVRAKAAGQNVNWTGVPGPDVTGQTRTCVCVCECRAGAYLCANSRCVMPKKCSYCCLSVINDALLGLVGSGLEQV